MSDSDDGSRSGIVREYHRRIESAIRDRDVGRAIDLRADLASESPAIEDLLSEFADAVEDGEYEEAETVRHAIRERLAEKRARNKAAVQRSTLARDGGDLSAEGRRTIREHVESGLDLSSARASFLLTSALFLARPDDGDDGEELVAESTALRDREREHDRRESEAASTIDDDALPASVELIEGGADASSIAVGSPSTVQVRVENVGGETATDVTLTVDAPDAVSVSPAEQTLGAIDAGESEVATVTVSADDPGEYKLGATARSDTGGSSHMRLGIEVTETGASSPLLEAFSGEDGEVRFDDVVDAIAHFNEGESIPGTDDPVAFQDVVWIIERFNRGD